MIRIYWRLVIPIDTKHLDIYLRCASTYIYVFKIIWACLIMLRVIPTHKYNFVGHYFGATFSSMTSETSFLRMKRKGQHSLTAQWDGKDIHKKSYYYRKCFSFNSQTTDHLKPNFQALKGEDSQFRARVDSEPQKLNDVKDRIGQVCGSSLVNCVWRVEDNNRWVVDSKTVLWF